MSGVCQRDVTDQFKFRKFRAPAFGSLLILALVQVTWCAFLFNAPARTGTALLVGLCLLSISSRSIFSSLQQHFAFYFSWTCRLRWLQFRADISIRKQFPYKIYKQNPHYHQDVGRLSSWCRGQEQPSQVRRQVRV